jgi:hypothetical protein
MTTTTSQRRSPPSEDILREWAQHWPFERATADLIRRAQQHTNQQRRQPTQPQGEPAPF